jgi:isopentenyl-diphosphate delta-isomerase
MAKAFALGADIAASARILLKELDSGGVEGVINQINDWFGILRKIMFLTNSKTLKQLRNKKLIRKDKLF